MDASEPIAFTSSFFPVDPGEAAETNPGIYGRALAHWLAAALRERGLAAEDPFAEDWGWCITVKRRPLMVRVACASPSRGTTTEWQAFAFAERTALQWLRRSGDPAAEVRALRDHLAAIIPTIPDVRDIEWDHD